MWDLVGNPENRFSQNENQIGMVRRIFLDSIFLALDYSISMFMIGLAHRFMHAR